MIIWRTQSTFWSRILQNKDKTNKVKILKKHTSCKKLNSSAQVGKTRWLITYFKNIKRQDRPKTEKKKKIPMKVLVSITYICIKAMCCFNQTSGLCPSCREFWVFLTLWQEVPQTPARLVKITHFSCKGKNVTKNETLKNIKAQLGKPCCGDFAS